jgi:hypothetical protein
MGDRQHHWQCKMSRIESLSHVGPSSVPIKIRASNSLEGNITALDNPSFFFINSTMGPALRSKAREMWQHDVDGP